MSVVQAIHSGVSCIAGEERILSTLEGTRTLMLYRLQVVRAICECLELARLNVTDDNSKALVGPIISILQASTVFSPSNPSIVHEHAST